MTLRVIVAPSAFKHSLTVNQAVDALASGLIESGLDAEVLRMPIADGGNGTLDAFLARGGERRSCRVHDPLGRAISAAYGLVNAGRTAVIEMALASGLELLDDHEHDPLRATTAGTGELLQDALTQGVERVIIGMGGSATVDGGIGCAGALGVRFFDADGAPLPAVPESLDRVLRIDTSQVDPRWNDVEVTIAADVTNPLLGETGAAQVFGPQKGAAMGDVPVLEARLSHFYDMVAKQLNVNVRTVPGSGAAGALSAALMAFLGGEIRSGVDLILEYHKFTERLADADLVLTGEGRLDDQTAFGKGPAGVARLARQADVPVVAFAGALEADEMQLQDAGITSVVPLVTGPMSLDKALADAPRLLLEAARRLGFTLKLGMALAQRG